MRRCILAKVTVGIRRNATLSCNLNLHFGGIVLEVESESLEVHAVVSLEAIVQSKSELSRQKSKINDRGTIVPSYFLSPLSMTFAVMTFGAAPAASAQGMTGSLSSDFAPRSATSVSAVALVGRKRSLMARNWRGPTVADGACAASCRTTRTTHPPSSRAQAWAPVS
jgi:hypothetical protein